MSGHWGRSLSRDTLVSLADLAGLQGVPRPAKRHSLCSVSWVFPGSPLGGTCLEHLPGKNVQEAYKTDAQATLGGPPRCGGAVAILPAPHPIPEGTLA